MSEPPTRRQRGKTEGKDTAGPKPSPRWWAPVMVTFMIVGLLWAVTFYLTQSEYPIPGLDNWNLAIAFGIILVGFAMTTRWR